MRVRLEIHSDSPIMLSTGYNRAIQGMIYSLLSSELREFLHDKGYVYGNKRFKLFTFSRLLGRFSLRGSYMIFDKYVNLIISSPVRRFIEELCNSILQREYLEIEINKLKVKSIEFLQEPTIGEDVTVYTLSPIVVYSTLFTRDGKKKTYYYSPTEKEFSELITRNLNKKYHLLNKGDNMPDLQPPVSIKPLIRPKEVITSFKGTVIKGYIGKFKIIGNKELILTGYRCGLGSKNSAGFGMIEVLHND